MEAFEKSGNQAAAIEQFDGLRKMLRVELGVDPLPATIAKYEALIKRYLTKLTSPCRPSQLHASPEGSIPWGTLLLHRRLLLLECRIMVIIVHSNFSLRHLVSFCPEAIPSKNSTKRNIGGRRFVTAARPDEY